MSDEIYVAWDSGTQLKNEMSYIGWELYLTDLCRTDCMLHEIMSDGPYVA